MKFAEASFNWIYVLDNQTYLAWYSWFLKRTTNYKWEAMELLPVEYFDFVPPSILPKNYNGSRHFIGTSTFMNIMHFTENAYSTFIALPLKLYKGTSAREWFWHFLFDIAKDWEKMMRMRFPRTCHISPQTLFSEVQSWKWYDFVLCRFTGLSASLRKMSVGGLMTGTVFKITHRLL